MTELGVMPRGEARETIGPEGPTSAPVPVNPPPPPPGPGVWQLDVSHFARPLTRFVQGWFPAAFEAGQARAFARYGAPLKTIRFQVVDGFPYLQAEPLSGSPSASPPPRWLFALLVRILPEFRRCARVAESVFQRKLWREDARLWNEEIWPQLESRFLALQAEPLETLDDEGLLEHLDRTRLLQIDAIEAHFGTNPATMIPCGRFARFVGRFLDVGASEILAGLQGSSALLASERAQLDEIRALLRPEDLEGAPGDVLARLRAREDELGNRVRAWLTRVEHRQVWSGDVYFPTNGELPHLLIEQLRASPRPVADPEAPLAALRERIPEQHRPDFDELLEEARATVHLRDERSTLNDAWAGGILRRALLEAGHRLTRRGLLAQPTDVVHLTYDECASLLRFGEGPDREAIAAWAEGQARSIDSMPIFLGGDQPPEPPFDAIPGPLGELLLAALAYVELMEGDLSATGGDGLSGTPASAGEYIGVARVVNGPEDFHRVRPGDVLVARATMPSYNGALAVAGAVVTDRGGALSHAAIVSRELGIPAVVSTKRGTRSIPDGARVRVDGTRGQVEILP